MSPSSLDDNDAVVLDGDFNLRQIATFARAIHAEAIRNFENRSMGRTGDQIVLHLDWLAIFGQWSSVMRASIHEGSNFVALLDHVVRKAITLAARKKQETWFPFGESFYFTENAAGGGSTEMPVPRVRHTRQG